MAALRKRMHVPIGLPAPEWMLKIGAAIIGTEPELLLKSRWVLPARLLKEGFSFNTRISNLRWHIYSGIKAVSGEALEICSNNIHLHSTKPPPWLLPTGRSTLPTAKSNSK